jgi:hypothetical protein
MPAHTLTLVHHFYLGAAACKTSFGDIPAGESRVMRVGSIRRCPLMDYYGRPNVGVVVSCSAHLMVSYKCLFGDQHFAKKGNKYSRGY